MAHTRWTQTLTLALCLSFFIGGSASSAKAQEVEVVSGSGVIPNQVDSTYELEFRPPPQHVEAPDIATKNGLFKAYKLPAPDGFSRSFFTVAFQKKAELPGLRTLSEFVDVDLHTFRKNFSNGVIAQVNIQGRIPAKLGGLGFPLEMFMFKGNERPGSRRGDSLVLIFSTPDGYWSVVWTIPQQFIHQGLPVFFEPFIEGITATPRLNSK